MVLNPGRPTLVLATAGTPNSAGAVRCAGWLSAAYDVRVEVIAVHSETASITARIEKLIQAELGRAPAWPVTVLDGDRSSVLADVAGTREATLLLLGTTAAPSQGHDPPPLAEQLATATAIPLLSVPAQLRNRPHRLLCGIDFGRSSLHAAGVALDMVGHPAEVVLLRADGPTPSARQSHMQLLFDTVEDALGRSPDRHMTKVTVPGDLAEAMLYYATTHRIDLIAVGRPRPNPLTQGNRVGDVARDVMRGASCAVLLGGDGDHIRHVVPPPACGHAANLIATGRAGPSALRGASTCIMIRQIGNPKQFCDGS